METCNKIGKRKYEYNDLVILTCIFFN